MKPILLALIAFCLTTPDILQVRQLYTNAPASEDKCKELLRLLKPVNEKNNPLLAGYKGCATMIMAKHAFNPFSKLSFFNRGKKMLETAIKADTLNIELRYLRFTVQTNAPAFLGYNGMLKKDRAFLQRALPKVNDAHLRSMITLALKPK